MSFYVMKMQEHFNEICIVIGLASHSCNLLALVIIFIKFEAHVIVSLDRVWHIKLL